ncbi:MAG: efflux RND transporter periplasmic adaptor subunit [Burkholderiales bacterium]
MLVAGIAACGKEVVEKTEVVRPVRAIKLGDTSAFARRWFSGRAQATQEIDLSFRVAGPLVERPVNVGDIVEKGDLIAKIDPATFVTDVNKMKAELERAHAERVNADAQLKRHRTMAEKGHVSQAELDVYIAAADVAKAAVGEQEAALRRAELDLSYTTLTAPFAGEIVRTYVENFQDVQAKQPVVRLVDTSRIEMVVDIPESLISLAHLVKDVEVVFDPFPALTIPAKIKEIGSEASETTRTYPVTVMMDQPEDVKILPGMAGKGSPKDDPAAELTQGQLIVPDTAIFSEDEGAKTFVWIVDDEALTVSKREVQLNGLTKQGYVVQENLAMGEWIVTAGVNYLREGQKVRLLEH